LINVNESSQEALLSSIKAGDILALIDCQTFSPEFIPVLKAFMIQRRSAIPFQNGRLLNLSPPLPDVPHSTPNLHEAKVTEITDLDIDVDLSDVSSAEINSQMAELVAKSELDPIVQIRQIIELRKALVAKLSSLVSSATLDSGQLTSFVESLKYPVHLTQGPPGTGKVLFYFSNVSYSLAPSLILQSFHSLILAW
jgi:hypothetical protein